MCVRAEVFGSRHDFERFCTDEGDGITASLVAHCRNTRLRIGVPLEPMQGDPGQWHGEITLDRRQVRGTVSLRAVLTDTRTAHAHRLLASSDPWILIDDKTSGIGVQGDFSPSVKWLNFRDAQTHPHLQREADQPYYVDLFGELPMIFMNSGFAGLADVFPQEGKPEGLLYPIHEAMCVGISRSAWQAMFYTSVACLCVTSTSDNDIELPTGWQGLVLRHLLPRIYPSISISSALGQVMSDSTSENCGALQSRVLSVINNLIGDGKSLRRAFNVLNELSGRPGESPS